jgi:quinol monooxygenase YgiN
MTHGGDDIKQLTLTKTAEMRRRDFLAGVATTITLVSSASWAIPQPKEEMYGEIGKIIALSGKRDEMIANILEGINNMPGCLSYIVAKDRKNADAIWISEVWESKASHDASLSLPSVKTAIAKNMPLIASFSDSIVTVPVGGQGLPKRP